MSENLSKELLDTVKQFNVFSHVGFEGRSERLSCVYTAAILAFFTALVFSKALTTNPLSCYYPVVPKDNAKGFVGLVDIYCWANSTYRILDNGTLPDNEDDWAALDKKDKISYYQYAAIILGLQCLLYYLPLMMWKKMSYSLLHFDCNYFITEARSAMSEINVDKRGKAINGISRRIHDLVSNPTSQTEPHGFRNAVFGKWRLNFNGRKLSFLFIIFKGIYVAIALVHFVRMTMTFGWISPRFLIEQSFYNTPFSANTTIERIFPIITYCYFPSSLGLGLNNHYVGQCSLPVNMILGKIYMFIYYWIILVAVVSIAGLILHLYQSLRQYPKYQLIKGLLKIRNCYEKKDRSIIMQFVSEYLRADGCLLIKKIKDNANVLVASEVVESMFGNYQRTIRSGDSSASSSTPPPVVPRKCNDKIIVTVSERVPTHSRDIPSSSQHV